MVGPCDKNLPHNSELGVLAEPLVDLPIFRLFQNELYHCVSSSTFPSQFCSLGLMACFNVGFDKCIFCSIFDFYCFHRSFAQQKHHGKR